MIAGNYFRIHNILLNQMKSFFSITLLFVLFVSNGFSQLNDTLVKEVNRCLISSIGTDAIIVTELQMSAKVHYDEGYKLNNEMKFDSATVAFIKAIEIDSTGNCGTGLNGTVYSELGYSFSRLKKMDSAFYFLDQSIRINPKYPKAYVNKSMLLKNQKKYEEAVDVMNALLKLNPDFVIAYALQSTFHHLEGKNKLAVADMTIYLQKVKTGKEDDKLKPMIEYAECKLVEWGSLKED